MTTPFNYSGRSGPPMWGAFSGSRRARSADPERPSDPIPDRATMEKRWQFRDSLLEETLDHRRVHPHSSGRSILNILHDRERRGARALTVRKRGLRKSPGDKSPATVFESPNSTTSPVYEPNEEDEKLELLRKTYPITIAHEIQFFAEYASTVRYNSAFLKHLGGDDVLDREGNRPDSSKAVSTISIAFSPDSQTMASTHGDHTVKISCCNTGRLLQSLDGHPRTPWTVKYHPHKSEIIASGCLGHQVRIWNWKEKQCLKMVRLDYAIISVSFHPSGDLLAVANGTRLHFWGMDAASTLTETDQRHMLRCVHFPPNGKSIIIGGVNPSNEDPRRRRGNPMSFYLRLWDFDLATALQPPPDHPQTPAMRRAISNPRTFVPRALLYNDGGFDVSPDGKTLCACAEYWLPDGVDNAMDFVRQQDNDQEGNVSAEGGPSDGPLRTPPMQRSQPSVLETQSALSAIFTNLSEPNCATSGRSPSFRDNMAVDTAPVPPIRMPSASAPSLDNVPRTPPIPRDQPMRLSPPSPPGRRFAGGSHHQGTGREVMHASDDTEDVPDGSSNSVRGLSTPPPPPPPPPPPAPGAGVRPPHPLSIVTSTAGSPLEAMQNGPGRYVPHVVTVSLETTPLPTELENKWPRGTHPGAVAKGYRPRLGQIINACPLDPSKATAVTCVKFSPSTDFCLIGYGVREPEGGGKFHPVTSLYRITGGMTHVSTMLSEIDDVNIARFHPDSGHGFVYGTKQGRVRILSPRPWNFYNC